MHNEAESLSDVRRLKELVDPHCNHDWLWALSRNHGPTLQDEEFVEAVRFRLGDGGPSEPVACRSCKNGMLDTSGSHALCCPLGEATRGHNAVRNSLHKAAKSADSSAELSHLGLSLLFQRYGLLMSSLRRLLLAACRRWMWGSARLRPQMQVLTAPRA